MKIVWRPRPHVHNPVISIGYGHAEETTAPLIHKTSLHNVPPPVEFARWPDSSKLPHIVSHEPSIGRVGESPSNATAACPQRSPRPRAASEASPQQKLDTAAYIASGIVNRFIGEEASGFARLEV